MLGMYSSRIRQFIRDEGLLNNIRFYYCNYIMLLCYCVCKRQEQINIADYVYS